MSTLNELSGNRVSRVKHGLERWREVVVKADDLLAWDKDWYAAVVAGIVTAKFIFVWYWDPTLITLLAFSGLFLTLADYLGPRIINQVCGQDSWTGAKEKRYDQVCEDIVALLENVEVAFQYCREARGRKPIVHFLATIGALFTLAWVGNHVNNFFLAYLVSLGLSMLPGLHRKGLLKKHCAQLTLKIAEVVKGKDYLKKAE